MNRPPAFQLYVKDWLTSKKRAAMALDQQAAYFNLLCHCWDTDDCALPDDRAILAALSELREHWNSRSTPVHQAFVPHPKKPDFLTNMRLYAEHQKYLQIQKERRRAGRESGASRRRSRANTTEHVFNKRSAPVEQLPTSSIPTSSSKKEDIPASRREILNGHRASFDRFWSAYPKKRDKKEAEKLWARLLPDESLVASMLHSIEQAKQTPEWGKDRGQFIPYPTTWLNKRRWEDDYSSPATAQRIPL
ncbi:MAG TPA: DUF1376 domain-containing protein [Nitrospira sp.]